MKQISLKEALAKIMMGQDVKILIPGAVADDWTDYSPAFLSEYLDGLIFFADEPGQKEQQEEQKTELAKAEEPVDKRKRTPVDKGKILALHNAGWDNKKIADEMGCSVSTVYRIITNEEETE